MSFPVLPDDVTPVIYHYCRIVNYSGLLAFFIYRPQHKYPVFLCRFLDPVGHTAGNDIHCFVEFFHRHAWIEPRRDRLRKDYKLRAKLFFRDFQMLNCSRDVTVDIIVLRSHLHTGNGKFFHTEPPFFESRAWRILMASSAVIMASSIPTFLIIGASS